MGQINGLSSGYFPRRENQMVSVTLEDFEDLCTSEGLPAGADFGSKSEYGPLIFQEPNLSLNGLFKKLLCFIFSNFQKFHPFFTPCHENSGKYGSLLVAWRQCLDEHASGKSGLPRGFSWLLVIGGGGFGCLLLCSFPLKWWQHWHCFFDTCDNWTSHNSFKRFRKKHRFCRPFLFVA